MRLNWKTVDSWRREQGLEVAELARRAGIPERTIYSGVKKEARLNSATVSVMRSVFPQKFEEGERP